MLTDDDASADSSNTRSVTTLHFEGQIYEIERSVFPTWDDYEVVRDGVIIGSVRVHVASTEESQREYTVDGDAGLRAVVEAAIRAGIIAIVRVP